jgi:hypothetical protein
LRVPAAGPERDRRPSRSERPARSSRCCQKRSRHTRSHFSQTGDHSQDVGAWGSATKCCGFLKSPKRASLGRMRQHPEAPRPTLAQLRQAAPWLWVWCRNVHCRHKAPMAVAPLIIRWRGDASSDLLRRSARCTHCGNKGADLQHPSARSSNIALAFHARAELALTVQ